MQDKGFKWNSIAALINAAEAVVMSMVVVRVTNLEDAGILAIAFAVGNLFITIGKFGIGNFQVSDIKNRYEYGTYFVTRIVTVVLMLITTVLFVVSKLISNEYSHYKAVIVFVICSIYMVEAMEDVLWAEFQRRGRLDLGAKLFVVRWTSILTVFIVVILITKNLQKALLMGLIVSVIVLIVSALRFTAEYNSRSDEAFSLFKIQTDFRTVKTLMKETFPLFIVAFLTFYINNAPKYALDGVVTDEIQAYYGFVAMPVFVINMLSSMIYQPKIVWLSIEWQNGRVSNFRKGIRKQILLILLVSISCVLGAALLGVPVLSVLYSTSLGDYWIHLVVLQIAGAFMAISTYFCILLTIMRRQKVLMFGYIATALINVFIMEFIAINFGTFGVAAAYMASMALLSTIYILIYLHYIQKG